MFGVMFSRGTLRTMAGELQSEPLGRVRAVTAGEAQGRKTGADPTALGQVEGHMRKQTRGERIR